MNKKSIKALYGGYVPVSERVISDKEEKELRKNEIKAYDNLVKHLDKVGCDLLEHYTDSLYDAEEHRAERMYTEGFSFGMQLAIEVLLGK